MRGTFGIKVAVAAGLVVLADRLLFLQSWGWVLGLFALAWIGGVAFAGPALKHRGSRWCLSAAAGFALLLVEDANWLAWTLFWVANASAALGSARWGGDALVWAVRLVLHAVLGVVRPLRDLARLVRFRRRRGGDGVGAAVKLLALPIGGGLVFALLFAGANPLVAQALAALALPSPMLVAGHLFFGLLVLAAVWPSLRPAGHDPQLAPLGEGRPLVALPAATLVLSLVVFNALFAIENALDLAFLWSGAPLPEGVTVAEYAREGAHLLVATALLAGGFVIVALHPGTPAASDRRVRALVVLWVAQNVLLVASSARRLGNYVAVYGLTELRIEAMLWMALVAVGLVLIGWRMVMGRSAAWLVNANAAAAGVTLTIAAVLDIPGTAAAYNVRHASRAVPVNLCYLSELGSGALLPLLELERRAAAGPVLARVTALREVAQERAEGRAADWYGWTWREGRRVAAAQEAVGTARFRHGRLHRTCSGRQVIVGPLTTGARP